MSGSSATGLPPMYSTGLFVFSSTSITSLLYETCDAHLPCSCTPPLPSEFPASEPQPPHTSSTAHAGATGTTSANATQASHSPVPDSHPLQSCGHYHAAHSMLAYTDTVLRMSACKHDFATTEADPCESCSASRAKRDPPTGLTKQRVVRSTLSERPQAQQSSAERSRGTHSTPSHTRKADR